MISTATRPLKVGDRVEMDPDRTGWLGAASPDLGQGTVTATTGHGLMEGLYVQVRWDTDWGPWVSQPAIQSLRLVD